MFPKTMGTILKERLSAQTRDTETEYCTVATLRNITPDVIPPDTLRNIERITKGLSVRLQGLMQSLSLSAPYPSTRGRLNTAKLFRIKTGNPKVFIQKTEAVAINTSLHILLDASASMYGKRMELATASCHAIASACSGIRGLNITITAFNGNHRGDACSVYPLLKIRTTRSCPHQPHSPRRDASGPALWWIMKQLLFAREQRKMLLVLTDGQPHDMNATQKAVEIANKIGLEVYGLGMLDRSIGDFLPDTSRVICRLEELPAMLFELLHDVLTRKSRPCL